MMQWNIWNDGLKTAGCLIILAIPQGAELAVQETDHYAVLTITDPFSAPWEKIPGAYGKIYEYASARHMAAHSYDNRICMEETYIREGVTYMDVYVPVDMQ